VEGHEGTLTLERSTEVLPSFDDSDRALAHESAPAVTWGGSTPAKQPPLYGDLNVNAGPSCEIGSGSDLESLGLKSSAIFASSLSLKLMKVFLTFALMDDGGAMGDGQLQAASRCVSGWFREPLSEL
jgi:hypothetical protein